MIPTVKNTSCVFRLICLSNWEVGLYRPAQREKLKGVRKIADILEKAVKLTESAVFPFARLVKKLETLPPGQAATKNIPKAMLGGGWRSVTKTQVRNGSNTT